MGSSPVAVFWTSDFVPVSSKEFPDIQETIERGFTLKSLRDIIRTYSHFIQDFDSVEWEVYMWSFDLSLINLDTDVCLLHEYVLLKRYERMQKKCCDPFQKGKSHFSVSSFCIIFNLEVCEKFGFNLISHLKSTGSYPDWSW